MIDWNNIGTLFADNTHRNEVLFEKYDPVLGVGSPLPRFNMMVDDNNYLLLPALMQQESFIDQICKYGSIARYAKDCKQDSDNILSAVLMLRVNYDFEYWAGTCCHIQDKATKSIIKFTLRKPQRKLLTVLIKDYFDGIPVRIIIVKARQWGGSTLVQLFMAWVQLFHFERWHSCIVTQIEDQARTIRAMYTRMAQYHPKEIRSVDFENFEGSSKNKKVKGRDNVIYIGSMERPDNLRSGDYMMAHLSEVGLWKETKGKKPEDVIQTIAGSVPPNPYTIIVQESTAKGIGNYFHNTTLQAMRGESNYRVVFVGCFENEENWMPFKDERDKAEFVAHMTDKERTYYEVAEGATLEGINWYRFKQQTDNLSDWRMESEFPATIDLAFQSTGRRAHDPVYISRMRQYCRPPVYKGDMFADRPLGSRALDNIHFSETQEGELWIWEKPDHETKVSNRYVVSVDIGGHSDTADYSVISVIDRYYLMDGGVEEAIATWRGHLDQDFMIWKAVQIAAWYNGALLVVEANSLRHEWVGTEGDHTATILDEIKDYYPNLYMRAAPADKIREGFTGRYGFFTGSNKTELVDSMNSRLRDMGYIERDERVLNEADYYEFKSDGTYGAVDGMHDDLYMCRAIGLKVSSKMEIPKDITEKLRQMEVEKERKKRSTHIRNESSF